MWVENYISHLLALRHPSSSLWGCELKRWWYCSHLWYGRSSSLWGCELKSFNDIHSDLLPVSSSLWGCELKKEDKREPITRTAVILLVRMWVEKSRTIFLMIFACVILLVRMWVEKYVNDTFLPCQIVILLVRMWVEKLFFPCNTYNVMSSSLWGCELKT